MQAPAGLVDPQQLKPLRRGQLRKGKEKGGDVYTCERRETERREGGGGRPRGYRRPLCACANAVRKLGPEKSLVCLSEAADALKSLHFPSIIGAKAPECALLPLTKEAER
ncbi:hypothetical protein SKAU_G00199290 [Synaphobranchus kaupii]|uniref:Uncharacterized protein n=1 Tax=Synaphobranchus kaupii TaxID=118154 RepID=A0A9Q1FF56_SYNKA|nr:hypothetical protein SKAU_G00199290 [Synaphobranchus kaupii]